MLDARRRSSGSSGEPEVKRERSTSSHGYTLPFGRRSPPGSQAGRAIAARKSEQDHELPIVKAELKDVSLSTSAVRTREDPTAAKDLRFEQQRFRDPVEIPPPRVKASPKEEDAHEWLLEHYAASSPPTHPRDISRVTSPSILRMSPPALRQSSGSSVSLPVKTRTPTSLPESEMTLEQVLENAVEQLETPRDLVAPMDVDESVTAMVVETLESPRRDDVMDVDVEDELLSLVDDSPMHRRVSSVGPVPKSKKPLVIELGSRPHSPMSSIIPGSARGSPAHFLSDRESMPPPATVETKKGGTISAAFPKERKKVKVVPLSFPSLAY
jgi:COMPASS component SPP1